MKLISSAAVLLLASACHRDQQAKGPFERAGHHLDNAAEKTGRALHGAAVKTGEGAQKAARATGKALRKGSGKFEGNPSAAEQGPANEKSHGAEKKSD